MVLLSIKNLKTYFFMSQGTVKAVDGLNLDINKGEVVGLVGESASGKSVTAHSIMRLIPSPPGRIVEGEILLDGEDLLKKSDAEMRQIRGGRIAMCFQDPMTFLNPVFRISDQISEAVLLHQKVSNAEAIEKAINTMDLVGIPVPKERVNDYPHHFSGGMRQRILLAIALSCNPELLIADEPTTALDVIIQAKVLDLMIELRKKIDSSILLITHDLGIVAQMADKVAIMYSGKIQEFADVETIYDKPVHPYTKGLLNSIPSLRSTDRMNSIKGEPPDPMNPPSGCRFHPRCPYADEKCKLYDPDYTMVENGHFVSCLKWEKMV